MQLLATDPARRAEMIVAVTRGDAVHQLSSATTADRYPELFAHVKEHFAARSVTPRILSFGCSTGEEVQTLRACFPRSEVVGVDINRRSLRIARRRNRDLAVSFLPYRRDRLSALAPFDLIFCLAVLQKTSLRDPDVGDSSARYPFERFDDELRFLDRLLALQGILSVYMTNYRFRDASIADRYEVTSFTMPGALPKFDRDNRSTDRDVREHTVFVKLRAR